MTNKENIFTKTINILSRAKLAFWQDIMHAGPLFIGPANIIKVTEKQ